jgi:hypothetical protein
MPLITSTVLQYFYLTGEQGFYPVTNFMEMEEVDFNKSKE